ncbi:lipopolysaccharide biosynthesis protein [Lichenifustis flavocetrariae]|uniref:Membrane protein involved in the export of O-antigen and teichoic acid n=1 Tax=Lichenifustis flavocetrariae TaxID=2949735 RepID=A0AA41YQA6_9HYPH|nr:hypothetical protein [Lichenifustis flavocetrariae]MCW6506561.1 hypothetical protein [Lichenifustis flavocetrariae]
MRARLLRGIGANLYGQVVTILIQLVSVPVLIGAWGSAHYGIWLLLSAVPTALAFADGGLILASGTAMTMAMGRGDRAIAADLFGQAAQAVIMALVTIGCVVGGLLAIVPAAALAVACPLAPEETRCILALMTAIVLLGVLGSLPGAAFRAGGHYAFGVAAAQTIRFGEAVAVLAVARAGGGLAAAASTWLAARLVGSVLLAGLLAHRLPWVRGARLRRTSFDLGSLLRPALASLAVPAAFAASLQGVTLAIGFALPPSAVAAFATARTLARALVQLAGLVTHALMPEMALVAGRGDGRAMAAVSRLNRWMSVAALVPGWILLLVAAPWVIAVWTGGRLPIDPYVLPLVATTALVHGLWLSQANMILAVNRPADYAWMFLLTSVATAMLAWPAAMRGGTAGAAAVCLLGECLMALWLVNLGRSRPLRPDAIESALS